MWGGRSGPPLSTVPLGRKVRTNHKTNFKIGGQECPPHRTL
jgi:hypothetical protein